MKYITKIALITTLSISSTSLFASSFVQTNISKITGKSSSSSKNKEIEVFQYNSSDSSNSNYKFLIQGGMHGNELLTTKFVNWLLERTKNKNSLLNQLTGIEIDFVPTVNPDVYGVSRLNSNDVNLNRNFSVLWGVSKEPAGETPFSEKETSAISNLFDQRKYTSAIDVHGYVNWVVLPTRLKKNAPSYNRWISETRKNIAHLPGHYEIKFAGNLGDGGAFEDWAYWEHDTLSSCLEMRFKQRMTYDNQDTFVAYEKYIYETFKSAIKIRESKLRHSISSEDSLKNVKVQKSH